MNFNVYKLIATSDLYKTNYVIRAKNLSEASKLARVKFAKSYKVKNKFRSNRFKKSY